MNSQSQFESIAIDAASVDAVMRQAHAERSEYLAALIVGAFKSLGKSLGKWLRPDDEPLPLRPNQHLPQAWA
jgi:hypothetical protein